MIIVCSIYPPIKSIHPQMSLPMRFRETDFKTELKIDLTQDFLDLSHHPHEQMGGSYPLSKHLKELDLTNCRLRKIENTQDLINVEIIGLRQNLLTKIENLQHCVSLTQLDLYDNQITVIEGLPDGNIKHLDLSFNKISKIQCIPKTVEKLYLCQNDLTEIEGLDECANLVLVELGSNSIKKITPIASRVLQELWLGKNKISKIENLSTSLTRLSLQDNLISKIHGLESCINLQEVYLSDNGISKIEGLENLVNLVILDVSNNRITRIENVEHLSLLEEFWCTDNKIETFSAITPLSKCQSLQTVYFQRNKIDQDLQYKRKIILEIPHIQEIDGAPIPIKK